MANLGFYSRHLTEEEVQGITATTRRLILGNTQVSVLDSCPAQLLVGCCSKYSDISRFTISRLMLMIAAPAI